MQNILEENPVQISTVKMDTVALGSDEELAIFVAPFDVFLRKISVVDDIGVAAADTNSYLIACHKKGLAGSGTDVICSMSLHPASTGESTVARVPKDLGILDVVHRYIPKGTAVTFVKTEIGTGLALTDPIFAVEYVRA